MTHDATDLARPAWGWGLATVHRSGRPSSVRATTTLPSRLTTRCG